MHNIPNLQRRRCVCTEENDNDLKNSYSAIVRLVKLDFGWLVDKMLVQMLSKKVAQMFKKLKYKNINQSDLFKLVV